MSRRRRACIRKGRAAGRGMAAAALAWWTCSAGASAQVTATGQTLPIVPSASSYAAGGWLVIGDDLAGQVTVNSGGGLRAAGVTLGRRSAGLGQFELRGSGALGDSLDDLVVGDAGVGELRVLDHARLTTGPASDLIVAAQAGGVGRLILDGYATADLGGHGYVSAHQPEAPGRPTVSLDQGATLRFALGNAAGVAAGTAGSLALGYAGPETVTLSAAGAGTLLDVPGVWSLGHAGRAQAELFDGATARVGTLRLGVTAAATLRLDHATLTAHSLQAGTAPGAPATFHADAHSTIQLGQGGLRFGPIPGVSPASTTPPAPARFTLHGSLHSLGPIDLAGTATTAAAPDGHRLALLGPDATLTTAAELRLGGPTRHDRAALVLDAGHAAALSATVDTGGTLAGQGTLDLDRQLTVAGTVHATGGTLTVDADRLSRFFASATLAVSYATVLHDHDSNPLTPRVPRITHGTLAFTDDARLDGTLDLRFTQTFPALPIEDLPWYTPFTLARTAGSFTGWFDRVAGHGLTATSSLAVIQTDDALIAQRALRGDANLDGIINQHDLDAVLASWGQTTESRPLDWSHGDFNGDGQIEQHDLDTVLTFWGDAAPPRLAALPVPEPAALIVLLLPLLHRRR